MFLGGLNGVISSFPFLELYTSIKQGGLTTDNRVRALQIKTNSPASVAGLMPEGVISSIDGKSVTSATQFKNITDAIQEKIITLGIERNGTPLTFQLTPRLNPPPGEGKLGLILTTTNIKKEPMFLLIPLVIGRAYMGYEHRAVAFFDNQIYHDTNFTRLQVLINGVIAIVIGIGLWNWRKWAYYGYILFSVYQVAVSVPYFFSFANSSIATKIQLPLYQTQSTPNITNFSIIAASICLNM
jgi:hypothetical protein